MNVLTNVLYMIEPRDLVKSGIQGVNKNFKKGVETVLNVWRFEGTNMLEANLAIIEKRKKDFSESEARQTYRDASKMITMMRKDIFQKSNAIQLPKTGTADLHNLVAISYVLGCVMSNGERGFKADDKLDGLTDNCKKIITGHLYPANTAKMAAVKKLGDTLLKDPGSRFDQMKVMISDQERVDLVAESPFMLTTEEELDTLKWALLQVEPELSFKAPAGAKLAFLTFKNFLELIVKIETDTELVNRRWDTQNRVEQADGIKKRMKFMLIYQCLKDEFAAASSYQLL